MGRHFLVCLQSLKGLKINPLVITDNFSMSIGDHAKGRLKT